MTSPIPAGARLHNTYGGPLRTVFGTLSPGGQRARLTILLFHRVRAESDDLLPREIDAGKFRQRMQWIRSWFRTIPLEDAAIALQRNTLPARALAITFDDGYADNCTIALPILRELGLHASFFISTGFLDGGVMFNDVVIEAVRRAGAVALDLSAFDLGKYTLDSIQSRRVAMTTILNKLKYRSVSYRRELADAVARIAGVEPARNLMMTAEQVRTLAAAGMGIGAHTVNHPILAVLDPAGARDEIAGGRDALESLVRQPVRLFAYPNGKPGRDYTEDNVGLVKELGFTAAVSTSPGAASVSSSPYELPRFTPWESTRVQWAWRLARNFATPVERAAS